MIARCCWASSFSSGVSSEKPAWAAIASANSVNEFSSVRAGHAAIEVERLLDRVGHARSLARADDDAIDDDLDLMLAAVVDRRRFVEAVRLTVDADAGVPGPANFVPDRLVLLVAPSLDRGEQV